MSDVERDLRYDTAALRAYAANLVAVWDEVQRGGMNRKEALAVVLELIRTLPHVPRSDDHA